jgi:hypothetical protein
MGIDASKSKKKGNTLADIKEEIIDHFKQLDDQVKEGLTKIIADPEETNCVKGMAKFYIGLDMLISHGLIRFPTLDEMSNLSKLMDERIKKAVKDICYNDYTDLIKKGEEKMNQYEQ